MKKINVLGLLVLIGLFAGCSSEQQAVQSNSRAVQQNPVYFTGNGGKGFTLAVLEPTSKELPEAERYLLPLIQGSITGDFNKYSAMTIIDRLNLDKILGEQTQSMSGDYSDEDYISIGKLTNARYILTGSITKTASNYLLELSISDAQSGERKASYPPKPVSPIALENLSAVKEASADLLAQLGVQLTDEGKQELLASSNTASVNAETALSKALIAQKNGTVVEALSYFYQAVNYDPALAEAASRLNVLTADISSGNMGENARNDIQWRKDWIARLEEAEQYYINYRKEPPSFTLVYSTDLKQGDVNYETERMGINGMVIYLIPDESWYQISENVMAQVRRGLRATGRAKDWGLNGWPYAWSTSDSNNRLVNSLGNEERKFSVEVALLNASGIVIGSSTMELIYERSAPYFGGNEDILRAAGATEKQIEELIYAEGMGVSAPTQLPHSSVSFFVNVRDVTDKLSINIVSVDMVKRTAQIISIMPWDEYLKTIGVREGPAGGMIFYDKGSYSDGWRYLEAAPNDERLPSGWDNYNAKARARYFKGLNIGGYTGWVAGYDSMMYQNLARLDIGNFMTGREDLSSGRMSYDSFTSIRRQWGWFRPVRAF